MTGEELKGLRKKIGLSQEGLASLTGLKPITISQIELGKKKSYQSMKIMKDVSGELIEKQRVATSFSANGNNAYIDETVYQSLTWAIGVLGSQLHERRKYMGIAREEKYLASIVDFVAKYEESRGSSK